MYCCNAPEELPVGRKVGITEALCSVGATCKQERKLCIKTSFIRNRSSRSNGILWGIRFYPQVAPTEHKIQNKYEFYRQVGPTGQLLLYIEKQFLSLMTLLHET